MAGASQTDGHPGEAARWQLQLNQTASRNPSLHAHLSTLEESNIILVNYRTIPSARMRGMLPHGWNPTAHRGRPNSEGDGAFRLMAARFLSPWIPQCTKTSKIPRPKAGTINFVTPR